MDMHAQRDVLTLLDHETLSRPHTSLPTRSVSWSFGFEGLASKHGRGLNQSRLDD